MQNPNLTWSIGHRIQHIMDILQEKCTHIQIQKQLKENEMNFCKSVVYTTQSYDKDNYKKKKHKKYRTQYNRNYPQYNRKKYYLRKSAARKP